MSEPTMQIAIVLVAPLAELDELGGWLRGVLRGRLDALRGETEAGPRRELDAWIEPAADLSRAARRDARRGRARVAHARGHLV